MKLSSFSNIIDHQLPRVSNIIDNAESYYAHVDGKTSTSESLEEHIDLVMYYARRIVVSQNLDPIIDNLCISTAPIKEEEANYIKLIFTAAIAYHDLGKINPNFQVEKMKNEQIEKIKLSIGSQHSVLSSFLFLHYFAQAINNDQSLEKNSKILLFAMIHLFCYPVAKHHSSTIVNHTHFTPDLFNELFLFLKTCNISLPESASQRLLLESERWIRNISNEKTFALFALLKLNYSLLTASDYYATNEYMAGIKADDFGIIDNRLRDKINTNFKTLKPYNTELFSRFDAFIMIPFEELQEPSKQNLNFLRQKLTAEVISTLRTNPTSYWYYIEAPTGAGKTNLSLACINELLQIDKSLNNIFYVFPFTTLITQTYKGIQDTIGVDNSEMIQLHSKAGFHSNEKYQDGEYGSEKKLHLNNLFVNYPICLTSHIRFFNILKGNDKESNYLLHRLCNSIVVIDELQTYNPKHWDKITYFIEKYAPLLNMRFIIMSATLPKIDALSENIKGSFIHLNPNKRQYFNAKNKNFAGRTEFVFSLLNWEKPDKVKKEEYLVNLAAFIKNEADNYFNKKKHSRVLIEFITKNTASHFFRLIYNSNDFDEYKLFILSGDILEPRRQNVIADIKNERYDKVIVVSTQVVEAGVDIDMDLGFKDRSLLDSDEQLAGRINRNASKTDCKVFLFDCDNATTIYGTDKRYQHQQKDEEIYSGFREILKNKEFDKLYEKVFEDAKREDWTDAGKLQNYLDNFFRFDFQSISNEFRLIENNNTESVFIPLEIDIPANYTMRELDHLGVLTERDGGPKVSGELLFDKYLSIIHNREDDFIMQQINLKKITGLMSQFTLSVYPVVYNEIADLCDAKKSKYGFKYLSHWDKCYDFERGFDFENSQQKLIL